MLMAEDALTRFNGMIGVRNGVVKIEDAEKFRSEVLDDLVSEAVLHEDLVDLHAHAVAGQARVAFDVNGAHVPIGPAHNIVRRGGVHGRQHRYVWIFRQGRAVEPGVTNEGVVLVSPLSVPA